MKTAPSSAKLSALECQMFLAALQARFGKHGARHPNLTWAEVEARLTAHPAKLVSLHEMERTGGAPDVIGHDPKTGEVTFCDCSPESPAGRTSLCYDRTALDSRKEHKPKDNAEDMAAALGVELLSEDQYHALQKLGEFDQKSSSWVKTPPAIRQLGGALFGDRRFGRVFIYHNGAQSYYSGRGFRGLLTV